MTGREGQHDPDLLRRSKISPHLRAMIGDWERWGRTVVPIEANEGPDGVPVVKVLIELEGEDASELEKAGVAARPLFQTVHAAQMRLDRIEALADLKSVVRVHHQERDKPSLNDSIPEIFANTVRNAEHPFGGANKFTGRGVMIGIIDSGINILHPVFRDPADPTKTRIRAIRDQTVTPHADFTKEQIEAAIAADTQIIQPGTMVAGKRVETDRDDHKHGTHVAGIAAGNGQIAGNCRGKFVYVGVAPEAELVIVKYDFSGADSILDAINFCVRTAQPLPPLQPPTPPPTPPPPPPPPVPLVINMSFGSAIGPHDGTDQKDRMIDTFMAGRATLPPGTPAVVLVAGAGNEGELGKHATGTIPGNGVVKRFRFELNEQKSIEGAPRTRMEIRFTAPNGLLVKLVPPGNKTSNGSQFANPDASTQFTEDRQKSNCQIQGSTVTGPGAAPNARRVLVTITQPKAKEKNQPGKWVLEVSNAGAVAIPYHAWIDGDQFEKILDEQNRSNTLSSPGSARDLITVGAYHPVGKDKGKLADFSSRGPRLDGVDKPDLSAPGVSIKSARRDFHNGCCCDCCCWSYIVERGTSMAAPHVTGAAALLLERNPALTAAEVKSVLMDTARREFFTGMTLPNHNFGNGKLHVLNALNDARVRLGGPTITAAAAAPPARRPDPIDVTRAAFDLPQLEEGTPLWRLLRSREGRVLYERGMKHWEEARALVNADKRVATVWHRNHGPLVIHHVIRATMLPHVALPRELGGEELHLRAARLVTALEKHASKDLIEALHATLPFVAQLQGKTLLQVVELFESRSELQNA